MENSISSEDLVLPTLGLVCGRLLLNPLKIQGWPPSISKSSPLSQGKAASMSSGSPPTQFYERRKKSRCDVDAREGGSSNPPPQRQSKRKVHRDFPRGRMHIDTEIEEVEGDPIESSADESAKDQTYKISPMAQSENNDEDEIESHDSGVRDEAEDEERMVEGTFNPRSRRRDPFHPSPTIAQVTRLSRHKL
jgi:hypothetical protein